MIDWTVVDAPRLEFRAEVRGHRLAICKAVNVGVMWEGFINGGRVLRARKRRSAMERLAKEVAKLEDRQ